VTFEILLQKIGLRNQKQDTKYREEIPASIRLVIMPVAIFFNFNSTDFIHYCKKIGHITTFNKVFVICNAQPTNTQWTPSPQ
jgi:hypothetical protein